MQKSFLVIFCLVLLFFAGCQKGNGLDTKNKEVFEYPDDGDKIVSSYGFNGDYDLSGEYDAAADVPKKSKKYPDAAYKCNSDNDCRFHYSALSQDFPCPSCDWGEKEWICLSSGYSEKYFWEDIESIGNITCEICLESNIDDYSCICENSICKKNMINDGPVDEMIDIYAPEFIDLEGDDLLLSGKATNDPNDY